MASPERFMGKAPFKAMRKLALLLVMGLLVNLLHAATMPMSAFAAGHSPTATAMPAEHGAHACDETPASKPDKACQSGAHLCCLGLSVTNDLLANRQDVGWTLAMNPVFQTLNLQILPEPPFKPPAFL